MPFIEWLGKGTAKWVEVSRTSVKIVSGTGDVESKMQDQAWWQN